MGDRELRGGEDGLLPVVSVESHELASPGKRLLWHLEHFRVPIEQCQFAGAPVLLETRPEVCRVRRLLACYSTGGVCIVVDVTPNFDKASARSRSRRRQRGAGWTARSGASCGGRSRPLALFLRLM